VTRYLNCSNIEVYLAI